MVIRGSAHVSMEHQRTRIYHPESIISFKKLCSSLQCLSLPFHFCVAFVCDLGSRYTRP